MATVACPGCGMPRNESEIGTPCPVCDAAPVNAATGGSRPPLAKKKTEPDPTDGLPADATELDKPRKPRTDKQPEAGSRVAVVGVVTFVLGALCGVSGLLAYQEFTKPRPKPDEPEVVVKPDEPPPPKAPAKPEVAPMPHEPTPPPIIVEPDDPDPELKILPLPLPGRVTIHEFNESCDIYSVPVMKKGEHVVLRGKAKVKTLRIHGLDAGSVLDASELEASVIVVTGKIDGRSTLKLKSTNGTVQVSAKVDGKSIVEINAPGGDVRFMLPTTASRDGSKIDNGSTVAITARRAEFKGDITGIDTRVSLVLTRGGYLDVDAVRGQAVVEYKSQPADLPAPTIHLGFVASTAVVRKVE